MGDLTEEITGSKKFQDLLAKRSRLRWGLTAFLVTAYVGYGLAGVWFSDALSRPFFGTALSWIMAIAYIIMFLSVVTSLYYVRAIGKLHGVGRHGNR